MTSSDTASVHISEDTRVEEDTGDTAVAVNLSPDPDASVAPSRASLLAAIDWTTMELWQTQVTSKIVNDDDKWLTIVELSYVDQEGNPVSSA